MLTRLNDNEIISKVLRGDQAAYALLVEHYRDYVFSLVLRLVKSREDAEEVAQDVFIKAYRSLPGFRGDARFSTWLYTIVQTTAITFLRKKKIETHSLDVDHIRERAENTDSGLRTNIVEQKSRQDLVTRALALLPADDANILALFYKAEQSLEEVAGILGIEMNAAKVRLHRARARLKEKMETHFTTEVKDLY